MPVSPAAHPRYLGARIRASLKDSPVLWLGGARQTGKSTLAKALVEEGHFDHYVTLDNFGAAASAEQDPGAFLDAWPGPVVVDEVQRVPELLVAIKERVDQRRVPGRYLLTGSADVLHVSRVADALTGRMDMLTLWPFSQGEREGRLDGFLDRVFDDAVFRSKSTVRPESQQALLQRVVVGGYPEIQARSHERRRAWFEAYANAMVQRDIAELGSLQRAPELMRLWRLLASRTAGLLNSADLARDAGIPPTTLKRYVALFETSYLVHFAPAWFRNVGKRFSKAPKLYLTDTGLASFLIGADHLDPQHVLAGPLLETFVANELRKQMSWSERSTELFHFRTHAGAEVDFVLARPNGHLVGVEAKLSTQVSSSDFQGLRVLKEAAGKDFRRGIVLYCGKQPVPFSKEFWALPLATLWAAR